MALAPLRQFGLKTSMITTLQAISGAGYPGRAVVGHPRQRDPVHRRRQEEKIETETKKILRLLGDERIDNHPVTISATTTRVPVQNGPPDRSPWASSSGPIPTRSSPWNVVPGKPQELDLPSAPPQPIVYLTEPNRPQPALDANRDGGMTVTVGRLRPCPVLDYKFVALGHNTIRGAGGPAILNAELMHREGAFMRAA